MEIRPLTCYVPDWLKCMFSDRCSTIGERGMTQPIGALWRAFSRGPRTWTTELRGLPFGSPPLLPHWKPRLLNIPGVEVEIVHNDLGIRIRPIETSATELPPKLTHEFGSMSTDSLVKVSEDRTFEGLRVVRPWLPWLPLAHDTHEVGD